MRKQIITKEMETQIASRCEEAYNRLRKEHVRTVHQYPYPVLAISTWYPGVWLEHVYDGVVWAELTGETEVCLSYLNLFLDYQKEDGQLPCYIVEEMVGYSQLQECVSFGSLCLRGYEMCGDINFLQKAYRGVAAWCKWQETHRMITGRGLIETFFGYDTGHDNSPRFRDFQYPCNFTEDAAIPADNCPVTPAISPDINAVYYGNLKALSTMAETLGEESAAGTWRQQAENVKQRLMELCFDPVTSFFYDVDKSGNKIWVRSISVAALFQEHLLDQKLADVIFNRYFRNADEFNTKFVYPSLSISDPASKRPEKPNNWGYFSEGLTMLRTRLWMEHYGYTEEYERNMEVWLTAWSYPGLAMGQELDPLAGAPEQNEHWYSATMLYYLASARHLEIFDVANLKGIYTSSG